MEENDFKFALEDLPVDINHLAEEMPLIFKRVILLFRFLHGEIEKLSERIDDIDGRIDDAFRHPDDE